LQSVDVTFLNACQKTRHVLTRILRFPFILVTDLQSIFEILQVGRFTINSLRNVEPRPLQALMLTTHPHLVFRRYTSCLSYEYW